MISQRHVRGHRARHLKTSVCIAAIVIGASTGSVQASDACVAGPNPNELVCSGDQSEGVDLKLGTVGVVDIDDTDNYPAAGTSGTILVENLTSEIHPVFAPGISITRELSVFGVLEGIPLIYA
ncbi:MAG: hypothetical protein AAFW74_12875, partial [Pseudomonadota bacterium]